LLLNYAGIEQIYSNARGDGRLGLFGAGRARLVRHGIRAWSGTMMRTHPLQLLKASTSRKPRSSPRTVSIWLDRGAVLRPEMTGFWALILAGGRPTDAIFPDLPVAVRPVFLPILPKHFPVVGYLESQYIRDQSGCALVGLGGECKSSRSDINIDGRPSTP